MTLNEGQKVVPSIRTKASAPMMEQFKRRAKGLSEEELCNGSLKVTSIDEKGHGTFTHPMLREPFTCHVKFVEPAPQA